MLHHTPKPLTFDRATARKLIMDGHPVTEISTMFGLPYSKVDYHLREWGVRRLDLIAAGFHPKTHTADHVRPVLDLIRGGMSQRKAAKQCGFSQNKLDRILREHAPELRSGRTQVKVHDIDYDRVKALYDAGLTQVEIARALKVPQSCISRRMIRNDDQRYLRIKAQPDLQPLAPGSLTWTGAEYPEMARLYALGYTQTEIGDAFNRSQDWVSEIFRSNPEHKWLGRRVNRPCRVN